MKQIYSISHGDFKAQIKELNPTLYKVEICSLFIVDCVSYNESVDVINKYYNDYIKMN